MRHPIRPSLTTASRTSTRPARPPRRREQPLVVDVTNDVSGLLDAVARLTDDDVRQASSLPGWTRGHVPTHLARGGEALRNVLVDKPPARRPDGRRRHEWVRLQHG